MRWLNPIAKVMVKSNRDHIVYPEKVTIGQRIEESSHRSKTMATKALTRRGKQWRRRPLHGEVKQW